jgi:hypothetical protein
MIVHMSRGFKSAFTYLCICANVIKILSWESSCTALFRTRGSTRDVDLFV